MRGKKILIEGTITLSREGRKNQKVINGKFEVGEETKCLIFTENGKKILLISNLPASLIKNSA